MSTKAQRSAAARKGWRNRRMNPYVRQAYRDLPGYHHSGNLPNIEMYGPQRVPGGQINPPSVKFSSGDAYSVMELDEFISQLRIVRSELIKLNRAL